MSKCLPLPQMLVLSQYLFARHSYISKDANFSFKERTPSFCLALSLWRHRKNVWFLENCTAFSVCCLYLRDYIHPECSIIKLWCWNISSSLLGQLLYFFPLYNITSYSWLMWNLSSSRQTPEFSKLFQLFFCVAPWGFRGEMCNS